MHAVRGAALAVGLAALAPAGMAAEKAAFIDGTYATPEGCRQLQALRDGASQSIETVPETLTAEGFQSWEGACRFTKTFEHEPGRVWLGLMFCAEANTMSAATFVFLKGDDGTFEIAGDGQSEPELYVRCSQE